MGSLKQDSKQNLPTLRWGIIGSGLISSWFVQDISIDRPDAHAVHIVQAIGSSSLKKGQTFVLNNIPKHRPTVYSSYQEVFNDPSVDIVYIGTPHAFHKQNCLDAIAAGKHVLCEKAFTINAREANEVLTAAQKRGVFIMEAMWTRFIPLVSALRQKLFHEKVIGDVKRTFCDFGLDMDIASLGSDSRLKNPALGAGSLLDIGIYSLTWGLLTLEDDDSKQSQSQPHIAAAQTLVDGVDVSTSVLMSWPSTGRQGILTSTTEAKTDESFCRVEGTHGYIEVHGLAASTPSAFTIYPKNIISDQGVVERQQHQSLPKEGERHDFTHPGRGFYFEADAVALDIAAGRLESRIMPQTETIRVMNIMDEVRRQGGARFPQDQC